MTHYWRIFLRSIKISLADTLMYRMDILSNIVLGLMWAIISIILVDIIYLHTDSFAGWSRSEVILLLLTFQITTEFFSAFADSLYRFSYHIRTGNFDFFLIRPVDPQFVATFGKPDFKNILYTIANTIPYIYFLIQDPLAIQLIHVPIYLYFVLLASILWISLKVMIITLNFWWQKLDNLPMLLHSFVSLGKYPMTLFPKNIQALFHTFIPIAFIAVIPTQALQGKTNIHHILLGTLIVLFTVVSSRVFWNFAIKNYSSASS